VICRYSSGAGGDSLNKNIAQGKWSVVPGSIDKVNNTISVETSHFSLFALTGTDEPLLQNSPTGVEEPPSLPPSSFALYQNYPNPFNESTSIGFDLPVESYVEITVYNLLGQRVWSNAATLPAGYHIINWNGLDDNQRHVGSGIYLYEIRTGSYRAVRKLAIIK
jgi:hypothetical protein